MKKLFLIIFLIGSLSIQAQTVNKEFDAELAKKLGADERGMKNYFFVILKTGTANITDKAVRDSLFRGHFSNMNAMAEAGKLIVAGPFGENKDGMRGLFIVDAKTEEEVRKLLNGDPTIREKIFEVLVYPWYGSAALPEYMKYHKRIEKK